MKSILQNRRRVLAGDPFAEIGGSGGKVDLYIPVEGVISEINESLFDSLRKTQ